jgi:hypothetical protein
MAGVPKTNKYDVELEHQRLRWSFWHRIAGGVVNGLTIASAAVPIWFLGNDIVKPLAGKATSADIHVNIEVGVTLAASVAVNGFQAWKGRERKRTIREQRARMDGYEEQLGLPRKGERDQLGRPRLQ